MNILQVIYQQLPIEVNCAPLLYTLYFYTFVYEFYAILHQ